MHNKTTEQLITGLNKIRAKINPENDWQFQFIVEARSNYGRTLFYPVNDRAEIFLRLLGGTKKTFTKQELRIVDAVGYEVIIKPNYADLEEVLAND